MKFGDALSKRVDMSKVKLDVLRPWISQKITDILHIEDDVIVEFVYNLLEEEKYPCPKKMQIHMTGFLNGKNARVFMDELWALLLSAQDSDSGIPADFILQKKEEILKREENRGRSRSRHKDRSDSPDPAKEFIRRNREKRENEHKDRDRSPVKRRSSPGRQQSPVITENGNNGHEAASDNKDHKKSEEKQKDDDRKRSRDRSKDRRDRRRSRSDERRRRSRSRWVSFYPIFTNENLILYIFLILKKQKAIAGTETSWWFAS